MEDPSERPLARETAYFKVHQEELRATYPDSFVAILGEEVLDSGRTLAELAKRVYARHGYRAILMTHVDEAERVFHIRSWRLVDK